MKRNQKRQSLSGLATLNVEVLSKNGISTLMAGTGTGGNNTQDPLTPPPPPPPFDD